MRQAHEQRELTPKTKRAKGERCCEPVVYPDVEREHAARVRARRWVCRSQ